MEHHFKLEFVDSGLYFVKDENNFIYPLLQVESGSDEKSNGSGRPQIDGLTIFCFKIGKKAFLCYPESLC